MIMSWDAIVLLRASAITAVAGSLVFCGLDTGLSSPEPANRQAPSRIKTLAASERADRIVLPLDPFRTQSPLQHTALLPSVPHALLECHNQQNCFSNTLQIR